WQARRDRPEAGPSEPAPQQPPAPAAGPAYPQSVQEYRRTLHDEPSEPTTDDHDTPGGAA
ncbi:MAG: hypothetical protein J2O46_02560, partial [Nocardioides sp.]|nr:hypothetical protein [Nocardioides sp.]